MHPDQSLAVIDKLTQTYFDTRPNRDESHGKVAVLFLASSGAGKSTIREMLVRELGATYVCNDEVRALLDEYRQPIKLLKPIVDNVWMKLTAESNNHFIIFDSNLSSYYMHDNSYYHSVRKHGYRVYIIALNIPEVEIRRRIEGRSRADKAEVLSQLPDQLNAQHKAMDMLHPNFTISTDTDSSELLSELQTFVDTTSA